MNFKVFLNNLIDFIRVCCYKSPFIFLLLLEKRRLIFDNSGTQRMASLRPLGSIQVPWCFLRTRRSPLESCLLADAQHGLPDKNTRRQKYAHPRARLPSLGQCNDCKSTADEKNQVCISGDVLENALAPPLPVRSQPLPPDPRVFAQGWSWRCCGGSPWGGCVWTPRGLGGQDIAMVGGAVAGLSREALVGWTGMVNSDPGVAGTRSGCLGGAGRGCLSRDRSALALPHLPLSVCPGIGVILSFPHLAVGVCPLIGALPRFTSPCSVVRFLVSPSPEEALHLYIFTNTTFLDPPTSAPRRIHILPVLGTAPPRSVSVHSPSVARSDRSPASALAPFLLGNDVVLSVFSNKVVT